MKKILALSFLVATFAVQLEAQVILQDDFSYPDGVTVTVSGNLWTNHSGAVDTSFVKDGKLEVFSARQADISRPFTGDILGSVVYASFTVNLTNLPTAAGTYFAHFKDNGAQNFRGRAFALSGTNLAVANSWRLGVAAGGTVSRILPLDLATNAEYRVVMSYETNQFFGRIWVDPVSESDPSVFSIDINTFLALSTFAFRQNAGMGSILVDDLTVGNSFADVNLGSPKPPVVYYHPLPAVIVDENGATNLTCVGGGSGVVTFQWQKGGVDLVEDGFNIIGVTSNKLSIVGATTANAGAYRCIVTSTTNSVSAGSVTTAVAQVTINTVPRPPSIVTEPADLTVGIGGPAEFAVSADGSQPLSYQWYFVTNSVTNLVTDVDGTQPALSFSAVAFGRAGQYFVQINNTFGTTNSRLATLVVTPPVATNIAYLRSLLDTNTWLPPTNITTLWEVTAVVTTHTNTTTAGNSQFFLHDGTAGIDVFYGGWAGTNTPPAGSLVKVIGPLGVFNSLLELNLSVNNSNHSVTILGTNSPMPASVSFNDFSITNNLPAVEMIEGSLITITNVHFPAGGGGATFAGGGANVTITNDAGQLLILRVDARVGDIIGKPIPSLAYEVTGVLSQFQGNTSLPRNAGYQLVPTRYVDIVTNLPPAFDLAETRTGNMTTLNWAAVNGSTYSIWGANDVAGPYSRLIFGLNYLNASGSFSETNAGATRFYRASTP